MPRKPKTRRNFEFLQFKCDLMASDEGKPGGGVRVKSVSLRWDEQHQLGWPWSCWEFPCCLLAQLEDHRTSARQAWLLTAKEEEIVRPPVVMKAKPANYLTRVA
jgi:hypothetical protein